MSGQAPQWLISAIVSSLKQIGATASDHELEAEAKYLVRLWQAPERPAHNLKYLSGLLERLADFDGVTADPATLRLAAIYLATSALTTWEALAGWKATRRPDPIPVADRLSHLGVSSADASRVQDLVRQLSSKQIPSDDLEAQILFDAVLELLGTSPQRYAKFRELLRQEAAPGDNESFLRARRKFIKAVLGRPRVFLTPFAAQWADAVRENLQGELLQIDAYLGDDSAGDSGADTDLLGMDPDDYRDHPLVIRAASERDRPPGEKTAPVHRESVLNRPAKPRADEESTESADSGEPNPDDTSTLESFDDLFSHRRGRQR